MPNSVPVAAARVPYFPRIDDGKSMRAEECFQRIFRTKLKPSDEENVPAAFGQRVLRFSKMLWDVPDKGPTDEVDNVDILCVSHSPTCLLLAAMLLGVDVNAVEGILPGEVLHLQKARSGQFELAERWHVPRNSFALPKPLPQIEVKSPDKAALMGFPWNFDRTELPKWQWQTYLKPRADAEHLEIAMIRHGETYGNKLPWNEISPGRLDRGDDELNSTGEAQARAVGQSTDFAATAAELDAIIVSPLRRALKTALLIFSSDQVASARKAKGKHGPVKFILNPNLRELNRLQRCGSTPLTWRHRGTVLSKLRREFDAWVAEIVQAKNASNPQSPNSDAIRSLKPISQPPVVVDWTSCGSAMRNDLVWWDSESDSPTAGCTLDYWDAHWRAHCCIEETRRLAVVNGWRKVWVLALSVRSQCFNFL